VPPYIRNAAPKQPIVLVMRNVFWMWPKYLATGHRRRYFWFTLGVIIYVIAFARVVMPEYGDAYREFLLGPINFPGHVMLSRTLLTVFVFGPVIVFASLTAWIVPFWQDYRRTPFGFCRHCRYDLHGIENPVCPECGTPRLP